jgi:hypothetical protein
MTTENNMIERPNQKNIGISDEEWRELGEQKIAQASMLLREIINGTGYGDFIVEVRRDKGITIKPTPWLR